MSENKVITACNSPIQSTSIRSTVLKMDANVSINRRKPCSYLMKHNQKRYKKRLMLDKEKIYKTLNGVKSVKNINENYLIKNTIYDN